MKEIIVSFMVPGKYLSENFIGRWLTEDSAKKIQRKKEKEKSGAKNDPYQTLHTVKFPSLHSDLSKIGFNCTGLVLRKRSNGCYRLTLYFGTRRRISVRQGYFDEIKKICRLTWEDCLIFQNSRNLSFALEGRSSRRKGPDKIFDLDLIQDCIAARKTCFD